LLTSASSLPSGLRHHRVERRPDRVRLAVVEIERRRHALTAQPVEIGRLARGREDAISIVAKLQRAVPAYAGRASRDEN
jgi:hypothetical protein